MDLHDSHTLTGLLEFISSGFFYYEEANREVNQVFYYEQQVKRELKRVHISGYRYNERLTSKKLMDLRVSHTLGSTGTWNHNDFCTMFFIMNNR